MKKSLVALAAMSVIGAVSAQSTVTLYGLADAYFGSQRVNGQTQGIVNSGGLNGSRWGLKVSEDLGNGMAAVAQLESGFNIDNGTSAQGGALFGRQAFVGLKTDFGTVSLGRHISAYDSALAAISVHGNSVFDPSGSYYNTGKVGAWQGYDIRTNNSIKYQSANFSGFSGAFVYGMGENKKDGSVSASDSYSISGTYANGPILVSLVHQVDSYARTVANNGRNQLENTLIGGSYDFGVAKIAGAYNEFRQKVAGENTPKAKEFLLGVSAPFGATTLKAQYARSKYSGLRADDSFGIEAIYDLSKRTSAYVGFNYTKYADADTRNVNDIRDFKNRVLGVGMRHKF